MIHSRKKGFIISVTILMVLLFSNIFGFVDSNFTPKYGTTTANVNFRKQANLNYDSIVKVIPEATKMRIIGEISNFYIVQLVSNEVGLISKDYSKIEGDSLEGAKVYENIEKYYATINGDYTNLRGGPGTNFISYARLNQGTTVEVIGKIDNFLMVVTKENMVGMIREDLLTATQETPPEENTPTTPSLEPKEEVLTLINEARESNGLSALIIDDLLQSTAQVKANDMVTNNYFSHNSPTYGSPFDMMKNAGILYTTAGENIAGNPSIKAAVESWLSSPEHKENILSNAYNYIGIGVEKSNTYGYVIVVMFIGK